MNHNDHVDLLRDGVSGPGGVWADFGSGRGAFTLALADLIGPGGEIFSIDRDALALSSQETAFRTESYVQKPVLHLLLADFTDSDSSGCRWQCNFPRQSRCFTPNYHLPPGRT
jgi:ubiquinone/menaquinone biosynthesis C-methylase UbiE